ncbi:MAG: hypothetical protein LBB22_02140 [Treponema sp.]|nr:hypothetical protein [Treponema sp.]
MNSSVRQQRHFALGVHIFNLGTYTNDVIVGRHKKMTKEKLYTDISRLESYNTGCNKNINGQKLYSILQKIHIAILVVCRF